MLTKGKPMGVNTYYSQELGGYNNLCDDHMPLTNDEALELLDIEFITETSEPCSMCDCE